MLPRRARPSGAARPPARDEAAPARADGMATFQEPDLPGQARRTPDLIATGGPFPHDQDGPVSGSFEGLPPQREHDCRHEYAAGTPGSPGHGAWRVVTGRDGGTYCTDDPHAPFRAVPE
ncbi:ribonuclease domain-containing protein [Streptomyces sp. KMM 9044]|uniref:ribonuclease domain-containing protein n=1 Tax=Streptomyces sp. KMM 9044 TaxID=2744474 RepID=UPI0021518529|nr:ribonuclease domain-containing protein [Streptomyces sp. KMM 9044]WAX81082.1 ribonuclease N [Streptomyces sp. KMM 9044]